MNTNEVLIFASLALSLCSMAAAVHYYLKNRKSQNYRFYSARHGYNIQESKLIHDVENLNSILEALPFPLWKRRSNLSIYYCNPAYSRMVEEKAEKVLEAESLEITSYSRQLAEKAISSKHQEQERRHIVINGERRLYKFTEMPTRNNSETIGYAYDISEIDTVENELSRYVSAQSDLLESSASAMAIFASDTKLKYYNNAFMHLWDLEDKFLNNAPTYSEILEILRERRRLPEQINFPAFKQTHLKWFTNLISPHEEFFYLPNGTTLRVIVIPHALGGLLFAYEDMTDRLALERSHNTLLSVKQVTLDNLFEGVAVFGEDGKLQLSNPVFAKIWKMSEAFLSSQPHIGEVLDSARNLYNFDGRWEDFRRRLIVEIMESRVLTSSLRERTDGSFIQCSHIPLPDGAVLVACLDVTDSYKVERSLREKNEALQAADKLKTRFLANISYELRSPLTSINGFTELLQQAYVGALNHKQLEYIQAIHESSLRLRLLIDDILDIATIEAGYMNLRVKPFEIEPMMKYVVDLMTPRIKNSGADFGLDYPNDIGFMSGDERRIRQVLTNILEWLFENSQIGATIKLGAREMNQDNVVFFVENNKSSFSFDETTDIFKDFLEIISDIKATEPSMQSLGLLLAKYLAEMHRGKIKAFSKPEGGIYIEFSFIRHHPDLLRARELATSETVH